eukprot:297841-Rhodomonas_salina.12
MSGTDLAYDAMRCPVLTYFMALQLPMGCPYRRLRRGRVGPYAMLVADSAMAVGRGVCPARRIAYAATVC